MSALDNENPPRSWPQTPEDLIDLLKKDFQNASARDLINCVLTRAYAGLILLSSEFADPDGDRLMDELILSVLWDIQGNIEIAKTLVNLDFQKGIATCCGSDGSSD